MLDWAGESGRVSGDTIVKRKKPEQLGDKARGLLWGNFFRQDDYGLYCSVWERYSNQGNRLEVRFVSYALEQVPKSDGELGEWIITELNTYLSDNQENTLDASLIQSGSIDPAEETFRLVFRKLVVPEIVARCQAKIGSPDIAPFRSAVARGGEDFTILMVGNRLAHVAAGQSIGIIWGKMISEGVHEDFCALARTDLGKVGDLGEVYVQAASYSVPVPYTLPVILEEQQQDLQLERAMLALRTQVRRQLERQDGLVAQDSQVESTLSAPILPGGVESEIDFYIRASDVVGLLATHYWGHLVQERLVARCSQCDFEH